MESLNKYFEIIVNLWNSLIDIVISILSWDLETQFPDLYLTATTISGILVPVGESFCLIFLLYGMGKSLEHAHEIRASMFVKAFIRYVLGSAAVHYSSTILRYFWQISIGIVNLIGQQSLLDNLHLTFNDDIRSAITDAFSISINGSVLNIAALASEIITVVLNFIPMLLLLLLTALTVVIAFLGCYFYLLARFLRIQLEIALAPLGIAFLSSESTASTGVTFLKSFAGDCFFAVALTASMYLCAILMGTDIFGFVNSMSSISWTGLPLFLYCIEVLIKIVLFLMMVFGMRQIIKEKFNM